MLTIGILSTWHNGWVMGWNHVLTCVDSLHLILVLHSLIISCLKGWQIIARTSLQSLPFVTWLISRLLYIYLPNTNPLITQHTPLHLSPSDNPPCAPVSQNIWCPSDSPISFNKHHSQQPYTCPFTYSYITYLHAASTRLHNIYKWHFDNDVELDIYP